MRTLTLLLCLPLTAFATALSPVGGPLLSTTWEQSAAPTTTSGPDTSMTVQPSTLEQLARTSPDVPSPSSPLPPSSHWTVTYGTTSLITASVPCPTATSDCEPSTRVSTSAYLARTTHTITPIPATQSVSYITRTHVILPELEDLEARAADPSAAAGPTTVFKTWTIPGSHSWIWPRPPPTAWMDGDIFLTAEPARVTQSTVYAVSYSTVKDARRQSDGAPRPVRTFSMYVSETPVPISMTPPASPRASGGC